jgi:hypothetical protein
VDGFRAEPESPLCVGLTRLRDSRCECHIMHYMGAHLRDWSHCIASILMHRAGWALPKLPVE